MPKRGVCFIKPDEPAFLKKLKQEVGYKQGPTVDTKREKLPELSDEEDEKLDDQPAIVVLKPGDLSAEEVEAEKKKITKEEQLTKADLSKPIKFKPTIKKSEDKNGGSPSSELKRPNIRSNSKLLSFNTEEEEEEEEA